MNNKGFVFIETIITVVVLMTTLILLYSSYSNVVMTEQKRLYHDDIAYVYKTQHIRDALDLTLDYVKFNAAAQKKLDSTSNSEAMYMYIFNIESDIYKDNSLITKVQELYKFYRLIYLRIEDIDNIKACVKNGMDDTPTSLTDHKCNNTIRFAQAHGYNNLTDYLLTLDVPTDSGLNSYKGHEGILISLIYETKNGDATSVNNVVQIGNGKYSECIYEKVKSHYNLGSNPSDVVAEEKLIDYYSDDKISFNMQCENAYYLSWVYL